MKAFRPTLFFFVFLSPVLISCGRPARRATHFVLLADMSASIVPDARAQMFAAIEEIVNHLSRGDRMTIIPVGEDASGNVQGHVLRFEVSLQREPYDEDLRRFRGAVQKALASLEAESTHTPALYTDILGTLAIASEELHEERRKGDVILVLFSDFLEDDREFTFRRDTALGAPRSARLLAEKLAVGKSIPPGTQVFCGALRSKEWTTLNSLRRAAVREFWIAHLTALGGRVSFAVDGPAMTAARVREMR